MRHKVYDVFLFCLNNIPFIFKYWDIKEFAKLLNYLVDNNGLFVLNIGGKIVGAAGFIKDLEKKELRCIFIGTKVPFRFAVKQTWETISRSLGVSDDWVIVGERVKKNGEVRKLCIRVLDLKRKCGLIETNFRERT
jgi:hypothetical protein